MVEDKSAYEPILVNYGGAKKSVFDMTSEEFKEASENIIRRAKEKAFSKGLPIYIGVDGIVYAEFVDGRREVVPKDTIL